LPGIRRESKVHGGPVRIKIQLLDSDNLPIFTWNPTSTKVAKGIRKALEYSIEKLGIDPASEGIILVERAPDHVRPQEKMDPDYMVMLQGAAHAGLIKL